jgi:hypothetical protein
MSVLRLLNGQGIAGLAASLCLALLLLLQKGETRHWKNQAASSEQLYLGQQAAFAQTVAGYRAAAEQARAEDQANAARVVAEQRSINERTADDYQTRIADARARAVRLLGDAEAASASVTRRTAPVPGIPAAAGGFAQASGQDRLPPADALIATEQAIQLDELIRWVEAQHAVDTNAEPSRNR